MSAPGRLTVVIPTNRPDERLTALVEAIDAQAAGREGVAVVVSDDGAVGVSVADHLAPCRTANVELRVVRSEDNNGPGAARNVALAEVATPWVAFMDADMLPGPGWLDAILAVAADPGAPDGIEGRVVIPAGAPATPFTHATDLSGPGGAGNVAYATEVLRAAGGFDERYYDRRRRLHFREDTDLHFRMVAAGRRIDWREDIVADHPPLGASYLGPVRLARRYYFDPLLSREHPEQFTAMSAGRRAGGVSLRRARHDAAVAFALAAGGVAVGVATRRPALRRGATGLLAASWAANAAALCWKRKVEPAHLPALAAVSALTPVVYLWHHTRGVIAFRHRPRYS